MAIRQQVVDSNEAAHLLLVVSFCPCFLSDPCATATEKLLYI